LLYFQFAGFISQAG